MYVPVLLPMKKFGVDNDEAYGWNWLRRDPLNKPNALFIVNQDTKRTDEGRVDQDTPNSAWKQMPFRVIDAKNKLWTSFIVKQGLQMPNPSPQSVSWLASNSHQNGSSSNSVRSMPIVSVDES